MTLLDWLDQFLEYLENERNFSEHTLRAYSTDIVEFVRFADRGGSLNPEDVDHLALRSYLAHLRTGGRSRSTIARKLASLRTFLRYLVREEVIEEVLATAERLGFVRAGVIPSPLLGPAGNREFLACLCFPG